jgi:hypothetical protein
MAFRNEIVAGNTLIREAIQSENYQPGSQGWSINQDGSAEFNDVTIRGGTVVSGTALYYNGSPALGNLILSIAATAGTDQYGNAYQAGITWYDANGTLNGDGTDLVLTAADGSTVQLTAQGFFGNGLYFTPPTSAGNTWVPGAVTAELSSGPPDSPYLSLYSPYEDTGAAAAQIVMTGADSTGSATAIDLNADEITTLNPITQYAGDAFPSYTPTISGGGAATFSAVDGWSVQLGKLRFVYLYFVVGVAGSGATVVTISGLPFTPWRGSSANRRQQLPGGVRDGGYANPGPVSALVFAGGTGATINRLVDSAGNDVTGAMLTAGSIWTFEGLLRQA